ncbi:MAG: methionine gamma-lyase family protein [Clostridia bacterium]|nr:methionine gamma-lyase family protein [Clostridia bacterium]
MNDILKNYYHISDKVYDFVQETKKGLKDKFDFYDDIGSYNSLKVLNAFHQVCVEERHFIPSTGYGNNDIGREKLAELFCVIFGGERGIVSPLLTSGTHTIVMGLLGLLRPGDTLLSISGEPYDTLITSLSLSRNDGYLNEFNIKYDQVELTDDFQFDIPAITEKIKNDDTIKIAHIQRSKGYIARPALTIAQIEEVIREIRKVNKDVFITVDNCYGEFTEKKEPTQVGADVIFGSLIKNPGAGITPTGGYIIGTGKAISIIEKRFTTPSAGTELGSYAYGYRNFFQGIFLSPTVVNTALKGAILITEAFSRLGYKVSPTNDEIRSDIAQSIVFNTEEELETFIKAVQKCSPIDSNAVPFPDDQPGYDDKVIMASGSFNQGSTIELSADAPLREPYTAYFQGGLTPESIELSLLVALKDMGLIV